MLFLKRSAIVVLSLMYVAALAYPWLFLGPTPFRLVSAVLALPLFPILFYLGGTVCGVPLSANIPLMFFPESLKRHWERDK